MTKEELAALKVDPSLHDDPTLKEIKDIPTALKVLVDTKAHVGASIRIPGPDAGEADRTAFRERLMKSVPDLVELPADPTKFQAAEGQIFERLGRPKEAKEYPSLKDAKIELPEGVKVDEDQLRSYAHKLGFTKKQYATFAAEAVKERASLVALQSEARAALKKELGDAFDDRLTAAAVAAKKLGASEEMVNALKSGNVPAEQAKLWIGVAKSMGTEGGEFRQQEGGGSGKMTPDEAKTQIEEMYRNPAIHQKDHPDRVRLEQKLVKLHEIAYPGP
jgi:hypothetical protein